MKRTRKRENKKEQFSRALAGNAACITALIRNFGPKMCVKFRNFFVSAPGTIFVLRYCVP